MARPELIPIIAKQYNQVMDDNVLSLFKELFNKRPPCRRLRGGNQFCPKKRLLIIFVGERHAESYRKWLSTHGLFDVAVRSGLPIQLPHTPSNEQTKCIRL